MSPTPNPFAPVALTAQPLTDGSAAAPDEIHLLPAPLTDLRAIDGRGPWRVSDPVGLISRSMGLRRNGGKLRIDVNHATEKLGAMGFEAPARGWITGLVARDTGIWAKVEWTEAGRAMVAGREYLSISPEIIPDASGEVRQIRGASLTNDPALLGLATLTTAEKPMNDLVARLAKKLGKPETASAEELLTAVPDPNAAELLTALQADVTALCTVLGVKDAKAALTAVDALKTKADTVEALTSRLAAVETGQKRDKAEAWMAGEIAKGRLIPADKRKGLIELFTRDEADARGIAALYNSAAATAHLRDDPPAGATEMLTAGDVTAKAQLLIAEKAKAGVTLTFIEAVQAVQDEVRK
jgi:phage I-like protein